MREGLLVSWVTSHRRSRELANALGLRAQFIYSDARPTMRRYLAQSLRTVTVLYRTRPSVVMVMQPPAPAAFICAIWSIATRRTLVLDMHTGAFDDPKWSWALPLLAWTSRRFGFSTVPNDELASVLRRKGVETYVIPAIVSREYERLDVVSRPPSVLVPLAYAYDEPLSELLQAARRLRQVEFLLTGNAPRWMLAAASSNVKFVGFVERQEYITLLNSVTIVAALTTRERTMQSVGYEALSAGAALVTSDTRVLRAYFEDAAVYVQPEATSLVEGVEFALRHRGELRASMRDLREHHIEHQMSEVELVKLRLGSTGR